MLPGVVAEDVLRIGFLSGQLLVTDSVNTGSALNVGLALGVVNPAALFQNLLGGVGREGVVDQLDVVLNSLPHVEVGGVGAVNDDAVATGEGLAELGTVQQVGDGLTNLGEHGGSEVALELDLAVAGSLVVNLGEVHIVNDRQSGLGVVTAGDAGQDVNSAGLQLLQLSLGNDEDIDNGLDGGGLTLEVALELRIDGQSALLGALIPVGDNVSAREGVGGDVVTALVQVSGGDVLTGVVLSVERIDR